MIRYIVMLLTITLSLPTLCQAAGPYMHALIADRYLATLTPAVDPDDRTLFINGTIFPDIRYLGVIKRSETHFKGLTLESVSEESAYFRQGMLLHSWVDEFRQRAIRQSKIKETLNDIPRKLQDTFLKVLEDQILQEKYPIDGMNTLIATIPQPEKEYGIPLSALTQWHAGLTFYFSVQPSLILSQLSFFDQGILHLDAETVKTWSELIPEYAQKKEYQEYVEDLLAAFDKAIQRHTAKK